MYLLVVDVFDQDAWTHRSSHVDALDVLTLDRCRLLALEAFGEGVDVFHQFVGTKADLTKTNVNKLACRRGTRFYRP